MVARACLVKRKWWKPSHAVRLRQNCRDAIYRVWILCQINTLWIIETRWIASLRVRVCWWYPFVNQLALSFYRREGRVSRSMKCNGLIHHVYTNETPRASEWQTDELWTCLVKRKWWKPSHAVRLRQNCRDAIYRVWILCQINTLWMMDTR